MKKNYVATTIVALFLALQPGCTKEAQTKLETNTVNIVSEQKLIYESQHNFNETLTRLKAALEKRNLNVFTEVDHQAGAEKVDLKLDKNYLVIFGNPKVGTLLMQKNPQFGVDLPMKALIYAEGQKVFLRMTDISTIGQTHGLDTSNPPISKIREVLNQIAIEATE